jgi:AcrR family transcriptional regulator
VGVAEIAHRAGVGRGTLFRNFPTKDDLIAAIVVDAMNDAASLGRELLDSPDPGEALFTLLEAAAARQQRSRALFEAVEETFLVNPEIRAAHADVVDVLGRLLARAQDAGEVRPDVGAFDVLMLLKGICETAAAFQHLDPQISERQLDLVRAALSPSAAPQKLRGRSPTLDDLERAFAPGDHPKSAGRSPAA